MLNGFAASIVSLIAIGSVALFSGRKVLARWIFGFTLAVQILPFLLAGLPTEFAILEQRLGANVFRGTS